jgi:predicted MFS family arabinose efflux permease
MLLWANDFRRVFWIAVIPGTMAVLLLTFGVRQPAKQGSPVRTNPISMASIKKLSRSYWWVVAIGALFTLARFSEAFLVLRAMQGGMALALIPLVMVAMNVIYALSAYPLGKLADTMSHRKLLMAGLGVLITADLVLAHGSNWTTVLLGVTLWGLHMGLTQGLLTTMVANTAPADLRGTAFGFFNLLSGVALLIASTVAGLLWDGLGAAATFYAGACFCLVTFLLLAACGADRKEGANDAVPGSR